MSWNMTSIRLEIRLVTRIHINTYNKPDANTLFEKKEKLLYLFLQKMLTQAYRPKWLIFVN